MTGNNNTTENNTTENMQNTQMTNTNSTQTHKTHTTKSISQTQQQIVAEYKETGKMIERLREEGKTYSLRETKEREDARNGVHWRGKGGNGSKERVLKENDKKKQSIQSALQRG